MIHLLLATGFEEIEAITTIDILRRSGLEVNTVSLTGTRLIHGAHGIPVMADILFRKSIIENTDCLILPGGMPGTKNLLACERLKRVLLTLSQKGTLIAAICAAPMVLGKAGLLKSRRATCYPGCESELNGAEIVHEPVVADGNIITANGPGAAARFAFAIAGRFVSSQQVARLKYDMVFE